MDAGAARRIARDTISDYLTGREISPDVLVAAPEAIAVELEG